MRLPCVLQLVPHPPFVNYRRTLKRSAQTLRRDPTPAERMLWFDYLRNLPQKFTRQKPLGNYIADFYCAREMLVIELDGDSHFTAAAEKYDERRTDALEAKGIRVIRFTNLEVMQQFEAVCAGIEKALKT
jgi:very-short-patch-repair endonuclease